LKAAGLLLLNVNREAKSLGKRRMRYEGRSFSPERFAVKPRISEARI
jgi:hypothetical protein